MSNINAGMVYSEKVKEAIRRIQEIEDLLPGVVVIHDISNWTVLYISAEGRKNLGLDESNWQKLNIESYHKHHFNPDDAAFYAPKLIDMLKRNEPGEVFAFFQQVRIAPDFEWVWHSSAIKVLVRDENDAPVVTITLSTPVDPEN